MVLVLTVVVLQSISFTNYALTTKTTNIIYGSAPYLTFDGGRTRVTNTEALLGITLSDGRTFTPTTNNSSSTNPIVLPVAGQSFADIGMLVPTDTNSIALSSLIGTPYNYWGDDDGDGQGVNGVTATGSLSLAIIDRNYQPVARNEVLNICKAPYRLTLSNDGGRLTTRYGVPNESRFTAGNTTYYISPNTLTAVCFAKPNISYSWGGWPPTDKWISAAIWKRDKGFITQSFTPSSYGLNFPTTGANNLYFDLEIGDGRNAQALSWAPVSHGGITATITFPDELYNNSLVRVTLTGPVSTGWQLPGNLGQIDRPPSLPQVFELVGRDSSGNAVVKYGFELKQWFVHSGESGSTESGISSWCNRFGYRHVKVRDLTNASCPRDIDYCQGAEGATPSSDGLYFRRHIGAGFFTEWGVMSGYWGAGFDGDHYFTSDVPARYTKPFWVDPLNGSFAHSNNSTETRGLCTYP